MMPIKGVNQTKEGLNTVKSRLNKEVRAVYLAGLSEIIKQTPVDDGRARNNWFLTTRAPSNATTTGISESGTNSFRELDRLPKDVLRNTVYFTNNLPYIGLLEYGGYPSPVTRGTYNKRTKSYEIRSINGFSKQRPEGWVRKILIQMRKKIKKL